MAAPSAGPYTLASMADPDEDDWVGEPPEGRISRDRAKPDFWANNWRFTAVSGGVVLLLIVVAVVLLATR